MLAFDCEPAQGRRSKQAAVIAALALAVVFLAPTLAARSAPGGGGPDRLFGGRGPDVIGGGPGNDLIRGGPGDDRGGGGPGRDDVRFGPGER